MTLGKDKPPKIGRVNDERVIDMLGRSFPLARSIAEIAKNSNDEYERLRDSLNDDQRFIVIGIIPGISDDSIIVLDTAGMTSENIDHWSEFGVVSDDMSGEREQGFGAKAGMRNTGENGAYLTSFKNGMLCKAGFEKNDEGDLEALPDWIEDENGPIWNRPFEEALDTLEVEAKKLGFDIHKPWFALEADGIDIDEARERIVDTIYKRQSWTLIQIKGISRHIPRGTRGKGEAIYELKENLEAESQLRRTLEDSFVFFLDDDRAYFLMSYEPDSMEGIDNKEINIEIPLSDPKTGRMFHPEGPVTLGLFASNIGLHGPKLKGLRGIRINDGRNNVWVDPVPVGSNPGAAYHIYGRCIVPSDILRDYADPGREIRPDTPESRAITEAITPHIEQFREEVGEVMSKNARTRRRDDKVQDDIDLRMNQLEQLVDIDALFEDGDDTGGANKLAKEISRIFLESLSNPLHSVNMVSGVSHRLTVIPKGPIIGGLGSLEQLRGERDITPFFSITSDNESVVSVLPNFNIKSVAEGIATITIASNDKLDGNASTELTVRVVGVDSEPTASLDPEPGPRGVRSDIIIDAFSTTGKTLSQSNTLFGISIEGPASIDKRFPPSIKTSATQEPGEGSVVIQWGPADSLSIPFSTTEEIHIPKPREPIGPDGQNKRKFPRLVVCDQPHGIPEEELSKYGFSESDLDPTVSSSPSLPTLYSTPNWDRVGIIWLNLDSPESRAHLRSPMGGTVRQGSKGFDRYLDFQLVEVAVRQLMHEAILREEEMMPNTVDGILTLRTNAQRRLGSLFAAMADGKLRPSTSDEEE